MNPLTWHRVLAGLAWPGDRFRREVEQRDRTDRYAERLGLGRPETRETVDAWVDHYRSSDRPVAWHLVRDALLARSQGREWRPRP